MRVPADFAIEIYMQSDYYYEGCNELYFTTITDMNECLNNGIV